LQLPGVDLDAYRKLCERYLAHFEGIEPVRQDLAAIRASMSIAAGKWDPAQLEALKINQAAAPDPCARVILAATAYALAKGVNVPDDTALAAATAAAVSGNIASGDLWQRHATYLLARSGSVEGMKQALRHLLQDRRLCTLAVYPRLRAVDVALRVADGTYDRRTGRTVLARQLEAAPVAAPAELSWAEIIASETPSDIVASLTASGRPDIATWAAVIAIVTNLDKPALVQQLHQDALANNNMLSWEERLLLNNLLRIR
jgi:hypothetical protein